MLCETNQDFVRVSVSVIAKIYEANSDLCVKVIVDVLLKPLLQFFNTGTLCFYLTL